MLDGYISEKGKPFDAFITTFHNMKQNAKKGTYEYSEVKLTQNSLWGSIAINPEIEEAKVIEIDEYNKYVETKNKLKILSLFGYHIIIKYTNLPSNVDDSTNLNINVGIGAIITSCARVELSKYTIINGITPYYIDTDSIVTDSTLPDEYVGKELGMIVLERKYEEAVFLAPKSYSGTYYDNGVLKEYTKVKGYKHSLPFSNIKELLKENSSLSLDQEKWLKDKKHGYIKVHETSYNLKINNNKSNLIYDNEILTINKPFVLKYNEVIDINELVE